MTSIDEEIVHRAPEQIRDKNFTEPLFEVRKIVCMEGIIEFQDKT